MITQKRDVPIFGFDVFPTSPQTMMENAQLLTLTLFTNLGNVDQLPRDVITKYKNWVATKVKQIL